MFLLTLWIKLNVQSSQNWSRFFTATKKGFSTTQCGFLLIVWAILLFQTYLILHCFIILMHYILPREKLAVLNCNGLLPLWRLCLTNFQVWSYVPHTCYKSGSRRIIKTQLKWQLFQSTQERHFILTVSYLTCNVSNRNWNDCTKQLQ